MDTDRATATGAATIEQVARLIRNGIMGEDYWDDPHMPERLRDDYRNAARAVIRWAAAQSPDTLAAAAASAQEGE